MDNTTRLWDYLTTHAEDNRVAINSTPRLSERFGMSRRWAQETIEKWEKDGKVAVVRSGHEKRRRIIAVNLLQLQEPRAVTPENAEGTKQRLLRYLTDNATVKGYYTGTAGALRRKFGLSPHDLNKMLFDLREQALVALTVRGTGSAMRIDSIRVRPAAQYHPEREPQPEPVPEVTERPEEAVEPAAGTEAPEAVETAEEAVPSPPADMPDVWDGYPLIRALVDRGRKVQQAARLLEEAGMDDEAIALLETGPRFTDLEAEVVRFVHKEVMHVED